MQALRKRLIEVRDRMDATVPQARQMGKWVDSMRLGGTHLYCKKSGFYSTRHRESFSRFTWRYTMTEVMPFIRKCWTPRENEL